MTQPLFSDLKEQLVQYKKANAFGRQAMLLEAIAATKTLGGNPKNENEIKKHFQKLSYAATLINYADNLKRMENQGWFGILNDFATMELSSELQKWFQINAQARQMKLLKPLDEYNSKIWKLFRTEQQAHLVKIKKNAGFNLNDLDIDNPPADQLYPIQIQGFGKLRNQAVDRIFIDAQGKISFANNYGYQLPGGGMVEIDLNTDANTLMMKMLEEHLEEQHGNLHEKAVDAYNSLDKALFDEKLTATINEHKKDLPHGFKDQLKQVLKGQGSNQEHLHEIVGLITAQLKTAKDDGNKDSVSSLRVLRAQVQVQTFKLTPLFERGIKFIKDNMDNPVQIEQCLDTRALGGFQMSNVYIMKGSLEKFFQNEFNGQKIEYADDLAGSTTVRFNLLESIANFRKIKFSHLLIGLAAYNEAIGRNAITDQKGKWDEDQFKTAQTTIITEAGKLLKKTDEIYKLALTELNLGLKGLSEEKKNEINGYVRQIVDNLPQANTHEQAMAVLNQFTTDCTIALEGKHPAVLKTILTITAVALAAILVGAAGFGIGFVLGLWTGPGAFLTAIAGGSAGALGVLAATGVCAGIAGGLTGVGLFRPSKALNAVNQFAQDLPTVDITNRHFYVENLRLSSQPDDNSSSLSSSEEAKPSLI